MYLTAVGLGYLLPFCGLCCQTYGHAITSAGDEEPGVQQSKGDEAGPSSSLQGSQGLQLGTVESHWQTETDYYAATVALDFLSFAFVALFYQVIQMLATCPALPCPALSSPALYVPFAESYCASTSEEGVLAVTGWFMCKLGLWHKC